MAKKVPIKYTSRDFNSIKRDLEDYAKRYYPDTYKDFSEASFGSLMIDTVAYVGDILSYYVDYGVNESFIDTSIEYGNVLRHARRLGYKHSQNPTSTGVVAMYVLVPANSLGLGPDTGYIPILKQGTLLSTNNGVTFILSENVNFANDNTEVVVARTDGETGLPSQYAIKAYGKVLSGNFGIETVDVGSFQRFRRIPINNRNISEIISVTDSEGNEYFEVDHLSQNVVYREFYNPNFATDNTPSILKPVIVARRFTVERDNLNNAFLQFGFGSEEDIDVNNVADPSNVVMQLLGKDYVTDTNFDPAKLLKTDKFGIAPSSTVLTIRYRTNTAANVNVGRNSIVNVRNAIVEYNDLGTTNASTRNDVASSIEVSNEEPIVGDITIPNVEELRIRAKDFFATQNRAVTSQDYEAFIYAMPGQFGAIKRCRVYRDDDSFRTNINIYLASEDENTNLTKTSNTIKNNLKTWLSRHKVINDTIDFLDAVIVNLGIEYEVVTDMNVNRFEVIERCSEILRQEYSVKQLIGQPFEISRIFKLLNRVAGVVDVTRVEIVQKTGANYSSVSVPMGKLKSPDGRYIMAPKNVVFEVRYPAADIRGTIR
jgi:hypothetical protein